MGARKNKVAAITLVPILPLSPAGSLQPRRMPDSPKTARKAKQLLLKGSSKKARMDFQKATFINITYKIDNERTVCNKAENAGCA